MRSRSAVAGLLLLIAVTAAVKAQIPTSLCRESEQAIICSEMLFYPQECNCGLWMSQDGCLGAVPPGRWVAMSRCTNPDETSMVPYGLFVEPGNGGRTAAPPLGTFFFNCGITQYASNVCWWQPGSVYPEGICRCPTSAVGWTDSEEICERFETMSCYFPPL
jgi:hypothetical protein